MAQHIRPKILIVDDKLENLVVLRNILDCLEADVVEARDGNSALVATLDHDFAVALLDVQMPGMSGYELAEHLRGDPKTKNTPLLFLTAFDADERQLFKGYQAGGVDFLTKPYSPEILLGKVRIFLEMFRARDEAQRRGVELELARDEALAANRAKSLFLANMSHELRTPMNAILGFAQILARSDDLSATHRDQVSIILGAGEHLLSIINNILDLAKIESGRLETDSVDVDVFQLLDGVVRMLRERALAKGVDLILEKSPWAPRATRTDPSKLRQILVNLVGNAIKFTSEGRVVVRVALSREDQDSPWLEFEIEDTGCGMCPEDLERIFEPFVQLQQREGTGLGLTITRQFIQLLGGSLAVESLPGKGSIFRFAIPYLATENDSGEDERPERGRIAGIAGACEKRILIVEDLRENRLLVHSLLEPFGFQLKESENGVDGIDAIREWRPHLVLLDRRMPGIDGMEVVRRIRSMVLETPPVVVAMTAHAFRDERKEMIDAGCDDFLAKPFRDEELYLLLVRLLGLQPVWEQISSLPVPKVEGPSLDALDQLSDTARCELRDAFRSADQARIARLLEDVREIDRSLAACLADHAENFRYDVVLGALTRSLGEG